MKNPFLMQWIVLLLILSLSVNLARANNAATTDTTAGIKFFTGTWSQLLAEAKKQNKPVFVDVFTTWCGPCKQMAKQAFPDKVVGTLFNANFISYQLDAEKGEGIALARKYAVTGYPTSIYVSATGDLLHRAVGYGGIGGLMTEANKAIAAAKDPKPIAVWDKEFASGKRDADFLQAYLTKHAALGMPNAEALEAYLGVVPQAEWTTAATIGAVANNLTTANSRAFDALLLAVKKTRTDVSLDELNSTVMRAVSEAVSTDERTAKTEADLERAIANQLKIRTTLSMVPVGAGEQLAMGNEARMNFYKRTKNAPKYRDLAAKSGEAMLAISTDSLKVKDAASYQRFMDEAKSVPDSVRASANFVNYDKMMKTIETQQVANRLNSLAWTYYELMTAPVELKQALAWSARSLELERSHMLLDTYAQLLGKLGRKAEAIKHEEEAIARAKTAGDDTADYEKTLVALKK